MVGKSKNPPHLEDNLEALKKIVEKMEQKNLALEDSLAQFEEGIRLVKESQKMLREAEQKIEILLKTNGGEALTPFEES